MREESKVPHGNLTRSGAEGVPPTIAGPRLPIPAPVVAEEGAEGVVAAGEEGKEAPAEGGDKKADEGKPEKSDKKADKKSE